MSGEQRGERGGPSALLSGLPVRDANAFAQRKLDAASFPACALLLPELTTRGSWPTPIPNKRRSRRRQPTSPRTTARAPIPTKACTGVKRVPTHACRPTPIPAHRKARPAAVVGTETTNIILRHFRQLAEVRARVRGPRRSRSPNARLSPSQKQRERQKRAPPAAEAARKTAKLARPTSQ